MITVNWNNIRPLHNSLNEGFEELVCQLAAREPVADAGAFRRIGKPDGGKECYRKLQNGKLHMWQAKYFTTSLTTTQWKQIDESVKTAIDHHPELVVYYVVLPVDLPDGKIKGKKSALEKWDEMISEWKSYAASKGMDVTFTLWGSFELISRLSKKENEGLAYFWFNQEEFLDEWFDNKNEESTLALGVRYSAELNVELPISNLFDGLSRNETIKNQSDLLYKRAFGKYRSAKSSLTEDLFKEHLDKMESQMAIFKVEYNSIDFNSRLIETSDFVNHINTVRLFLDTIIEKLYKLRDEREKNKTDYFNRPFSREINEVYEFTNSLKNLSNFFKSDLFYLTNHPFLLLTGEAGIGKSHLLADMVRLRKRNGQISLFLLGENFSSKEMPWTQILNNQLRKSNLDEFQFLGALNAKAESMQKRILVCIDALNEGEGRHVWPKRLKSFTKNFQSYEWLGLVLTVRDTYAELIAPEDEINEKLILRIEHEGFASQEYEATKQFFKHYGILEPSTPVLNPEFHNPLFLKLFCKSLQVRGLSEIPDGYEGLTTIIEYYLDSVNYKLSLPDGLYYEEGKQLVQKVVHKVIQKMVDENVDFVTYTEADKIVDKVFKNKCSHPEPFLKRLISEGIFNKDLRWNGRKDFEVVYFGYQRFQDHLIVSYLLDKFMDISQPEKSFASGRLYELVKDEKTLRMNRNLIEALIIQLPERTAKELFELVPSVRKYRSVVLSWINSLGWRKTDAIGKAATDYVNKVIAKDDYLFSHFLKTIISFGMKSNFIFNGDSLHRFLISQPLAKRDAFWTIWLQDKYGEDSERNPVMRLIDWSWNGDSRESVSSDSLILGATMLGWFLTSANRYLRDATTKALVCLFEGRPEIIMEILKKFSKVNDPYVLERLYAAAYGAVLRSKKLEWIEALASYIYLEVFDQKKVYPHILLRDYARGIIEFGIANGVSFEQGVSKVRPQYKSERLPRKFPTNEEIDKKYLPEDEERRYGGDSWGATAIINSMTTEYGRGTARYGDFGRYTFQSALRNFAVDVDGLSNYGVQRIFELGYDPKVFTAFDSVQGSGRGGGYKERIGKKYQWIVFYELLARVSDQCELVDESSWEEDRPVKFGGPWYPYVRDIDPTIIIKETKAVSYKQSPFHWWFKKHHIHLEADNEEWIEDLSDIPAGIDLLKAVDENGVEWLWLDNNPIWVEEEPLEEDRYLNQQKRLAMWANAYVVNKKDIKKIKATVRLNKRYDLPEIRTLYQIFSREYYWSNAFYYFEQPYFSGEKWIEIYDSKNVLAGKVHRTSEYFLWEEEFDCSKTESIVYHKPTDLIFNGLKLRFSDKEGEFVDEMGNLACFDPSVSNASYRGLLVRRDLIETWLDANGYALLWRVSAEKLILGGHKAPKGPGRLTLYGFYELENGMLTGGIERESD